MAKKVKKADLERLIAQYYCNFIETIPVDEIVDGSAGVYINIDSVYINVNAKLKDAFSNERMEKFAEQIEAVTFGNLKVTYRTRKMVGSSYMLYMDIANAYKVIE